MPKKLVAEDYSISARPKICVKSINVGVVSFTSCLMDSSCLEIQLFYYTLCDFPTLSEQMFLRHLLSCSVVTLELLIVRCGKELMSAPLRVILYR